MGGVRGPSNEAAASSELTSSNVESMGTSVPIFVLGHAPCVRSCHLSQIHACPSISSRPIPRFGSKWNRHVPLRCSPTHVTVFPPELAWIQPSGCCQQPTPSMARAALEPTRAPFPVQRASMMRKSGTPSRSITQSERGAGGMGHHGALAHNTALAIHHACVRKQPMNIASEPNPMAHQRMRSPGTTR